VFDQNQAGPPSFAHFCFLHLSFLLNKAAPLHCSCDRALWAWYRQIFRVNKEYSEGHSRVGMGLCFFLLQDGGLDQALGGVGCGG